MASAPLTTRFMSMWSCRCQASGSFGDFSLLWSVSSALPAPATRHNCYAVLADAPSWPNNRRCRFLMVTWSAPAHATSRCACQNLGAHSLPMVYSLSSFSSPACRRPAKGRQCPETVAVSSGPSRAHGGARRRGRPQEGADIIGSAGFRFALNSKGWRGKALPRPRWIAPGVLVVMAVLDWRRVMA